MRGLFRWAVEAGHIKNDPTVGVASILRACGLSDTGRAAGVGECIAELSFVKGCPVELQMNDSSPAWPGRDGLCKRGQNWDRYRLARLLSAEGDDAIT